MLFFRGNCDAARALLGAPWYRPHRLRRSRLNRRVPRLNELLLTLCELLGQTWKHLTTASIYSLDRLPIAVCDNYRIPRAKIDRHGAYRGYLASKQRYVYGLTIQLLVPNDGQPVDCYLMPGSSSDGRVLKTFQLDLPEGRQIDAAKAYNDYVLEDL